MPCPHKFQNDLNLDNLDFEPTTLIVGTFNPSWPAGNQAEWFYGRTHDEYGIQSNNFWDVLPRLYGEESLINAAPHEWKQFCSEKLIAITDLIYSIEDALEGDNDHIKWLRNYGDKDIATKFAQHIPVNIIQLLRDNPTIRNVYLTRGTGETFWRRKWRPVVQYAAQNGLHERKLLTPSGYSFYQYGNWNNNNPDNQFESLSDYILFRWQQQWHQIQND